MKHPTIATATSCPVQIFIAGDYQTALKTCRAYCDEVGLCVTVTRTEYVYTGGKEFGVIVGLINYPRFPTTKYVIMDHAKKLADRLLLDLKQESYSIQTPDETVWVSHREVDLQDEPSSMEKWFNEPNSALRKMGEKFCDVWNRNKPKT